MNSPAKIAIATSPSFSGIALSTITATSPAGPPVKLLCTYWGSDAGPRKFDILVNGPRIATEKLNQKHPGEFFDVEYALPEGMTAGQSKITAKFQADPGQIAGGLFDLRVLKPNN